VADFGLSRIKDHAHLTNSRAGLEGTVEYCAPEVLRGEPYSEKCDCWSYGVVLWELLNRQRCVVVCVCVCWGGGAVVAIGVEAAHQAKAGSVCCVVFWCGTAACVMTGRQQLYQQLLHSRPNPP
jgi:hypothetical protein